MKTDLEERLMKQNMGMVWSFFWGKCKMTRFKLYILFAQNILESSA